MPIKLKSIIHDFKSRSHRVVQDASSMESVVISESLTHSCWAHMPHELLREVFLRIEASEDKWPQRKSVVACAGVCRNWRHITKEIVKIPQFSSKITFPISLKQPGPREHLLQCFIRRNRSTQKYHLYLSLTGTLVDDGKFLLSARKCRHPTGTEYIISLDANDVSDGSNSVVGKLRSNFAGTKFGIYDVQLPHAGTKLTKSRSTRLANLKQVSPKVSTCNYPMAHISYEMNVPASRGPRRMHCVMDFISASAIEPGGIAPIQTELSLKNVDMFPSSSSSRSKSNCWENSKSELLVHQKDGALVLKNKAPRWHEPLQCWCLNFHGRVTIASVKNFQLVASPENGPAGPEHDKIILQFGKVGKDLFTMDYRYPISAFQAFAICLSSFDTKITC